MRNPNGFGSVYREKRPLRKPWKAVVPDGWKIKNGKAVLNRKCIGYFKTKKEGLDALALYHNNGLPENIALGDALDKWFRENEERWSENTSTTYHLIRRKLSPIENRQIRELKTADLEKILDTAAPSARVHIKVLLHGAYDWALRHDYCEKDYSRLVRSYTSVKPKEKTPFTDEEIERLWQDDTKMAHSILVAIYSGWRWNELMTFTIDHHNDCMIGGSKTAAGKNRAVPIHHRIKPIIDDMYKTASYTTFRAAFVRFMDKTGMKHTFHETRHTTATRLYGQDEHLVKLILGHTESDMTKRVYTHNTLEELRRVIETMV